MPIHPQEMKEIASLGVLCKTTYMSPSCYEIEAAMMHNNGGLDRLSKPI